MIIIMGHRQNKCHNYNHHFYDDPAFSSPPQSSVSANKEGNADYDYHQPGTTKQRNTRHSDRLVTPSLVLATFFN